jgi:RNA polymerase sigma factor (sigma-70 family)
VEASTLPAPVALGRISVSGPLLRLRSDEQLVEMFRAGSDDAFRVIHDRYRQRLFAYMRQMLGGSRQDAEDALQDVFIRAYASLRANGRPISLRAWLYRVAHNRCIDQLRRPAPAPAEVLEVSRAPLQDPLLETERREDLRRLVSDIRDLPDQQRSALLMREMQGMSYLELGEALGVTVPAVKSLLVRARMGLVEAAEARDTACVDIREDLVLATGRGVRMSGRVRRHMRECNGCREYRAQIRGVRRSFGALSPGAGPFGLLAKLSLGSSGAAGGGALLGGGSVAAVTATKIAVLVCCAAVFTGGALEIKSEGAPAPAGTHHSRVTATQPGLASAAAAVSPGLAPLLSQLTGVVDGSTARHSSRGHSTATAIDEVIDPDPDLFATPPPSTASGRDGVAGNGETVKPRPASDPSASSLSGVIDPRPAGQGPGLPVSGSRPDGSSASTGSPDSSSSTAPGSGSGSSSGAAASSPSGSGSSSSASGSPGGPSASASSAGPAGPSAAAGSSSSAPAPTSAGHGS